MKQKIFRLPRQVILFLFCLTSLGATASQISPPLQDLYIKNKLLLERFPSYEWNDDLIIFSWGIVTGPLKHKGGYRAKGAAGVIPYAESNQKLYVLLAKESWGKDSGTYCDLGGAVEVHSNDIISVDSFLTTLLKESSEESGYLYQFQAEDILQEGHVFSYIYQTAGSFKDFEGVFVFYKVNNIYFTDQFLAASLPHIEELLKLHLCTWGFQEKDHYEWIELDGLKDFLENSTENCGLFTNILGEIVEIRFRSHFIEALRSNAGLAAISAVRQRSFSLLEETYR